MLKDILEVKHDVGLVFERLLIESVWEGEGIVKTSFVRFKDGDWTIYHSNHESYKKENMIDDLMKHPKLRLLNLFF